MLIDISPERLIEDALLTSEVVAVDVLQVENIEACDQQLWQWTVDENYEI